MEEERKSDARPTDLPPLNRKGFIVPVVLWPGDINISVDAGTAHHSALISNCLAVFYSGHKPLPNYVFSLHTSDTHKRCRSKNRTAFPTL
jgi:hypothetical protein